MAGPKGLFRPGNTVTVEARPLDKLVAIVYTVDTKTLAMLKGGVPFALRLTSEDAFHKMINDLMEEGSKVWPSIAESWEKIKKEGGV